MNRTAFLIDGFNLYHSLRAASRDLAGASTRWLDLRTLCSAYLHVIGGKAELAGVFYFSALAKHLEAINPDVTRRHRDYIACLESTGVTVELAQFKKKWIVCPACRTTITRHEEKETDVAIATKLLELFSLDQCDTAVLVTGDSDVAPAVRTAQRLFPAKTVCCCFPYRRESLELKAIAHKCFRIAREQYLRHQFPDPVRLSGGRRIPKPPTW